MKWLRILKVVFRRNMRDWQANFWLSFFLLCAVVFFSPQLGFSEQAVVDMVFWFGVVWGAIIGLELSFRLKKKYCSNFAVRVLDFAYNRSASIENREALWRLRQKVKGNRQ